MTSLQLADEIAKNDAIVAEYLRANAQAIEQNRKAYYRILDEQRRRALEQCARDWELLLEECSV
jgi:hypothetical protein